MQAHCVNAVILFLRVTENNPPRKITPHGGPTLGKVTKGMVKLDQITPHGVIFLDLSFCNNVTINFVCVLFVVRFVTAERLIAVVFPVWVPNCNRYHDRYCNHLSLLQSLFLPCTKWGNRKKLSYLIHRIINQNFETLQFQDNFLKRPTVLLNLTCIRIAAWIKNPFRRTSEHNHRYNYWNF